MAKNRVKSINEIWAQADRIVNNPNFRGSEENIGEIASRYEQNIINQGNNLFVPKDRRFRMRYPVEAYRDGVSMPFYRASLSGTNG